MEPILRVANVTKRFGGLVAVDDVSFEVCPGEVVALLGDNGAGKSTMIKMVSGVYRPDGGRVWFQGLDITDRTPMQKQEAGIQTIYQDLALAGNLDIPSNIFLGREVVVRKCGFFPTLNRPWMMSESKRVLRNLDIHIPSLRNKISSLSGGQRQAVAIARSIYWDAKLLIMDEPTAALGVAEQEKVLSLVRTLRSKGVAILLISHQMRDVFAVADRVIVMRRGRKEAERIVAETNTDEVVGLIVGSSEAKQAG